MAKTLEQLRGLVLSSIELKELLDWPDPMIEDYLNIYNNFIELATAIDEQSAVVTQTSAVKSFFYANF